MIQQALAALFPFATVAFIYLVLCALDVISLKRWKGPK